MRRSSPRRGTGAQRPARRSLDRRNLHGDIEHVSRQPPGPGPSRPLELDAHAGRPSRARHGRTRHAHAGRARRGHTRCARGATSSLPSAALCEKAAGGWHHSRRSYGTRVRATGGGACCRLTSPPSSRQCSASQLRRRAESAESAESVSARCRSRPVARADTPLEGPARARPPRFRAVAMIRERRARRGPPAWTARAGPTKAAGRTDPAACESSSATYDRHTPRVCLIRRT
jgi:hypothetical protein